MIEASGLTRRFGDFTAVSELSFEVGAGTILALLGPNGAGKTTITVGLFFLVLRVAAWGLAAFAGAVALIFAVAVAIILISARTWRREEVMARRDA